jgi:hypothetical protein
MGEITTIEKIAIELFGVDFDNLTDEQKQKCHNEMINNSYKYGISWIKEK